MVPTDGRISTGVNFSFSGVVNASAGAYEVVRMTDMAAAEQLAQNLISAFEREASNQLNPAQWVSVVPEIFRLRINHGSEFTIEDVIARGTSNLFLDSVRFFSTSEASQPTKQSLIRAFKRSFVWEVVAAYSGPPKVVFQWRYWGAFESLLSGHTPTNLLAEIFGITVASVDANLKLTQLEYFFDTGQFFQSLSLSPVSNP